MTAQTTTITPLSSAPYLTVAEYKQAPTAIDVDDLVGGGTSAINDQELLNVIGRASSWIDSYCGQVIGATQDTEASRGFISRTGFLTVHPRYWPVLEVTALSYGPLPTLLASVSVGDLWIEQQSVVFPIQGFSQAFAGPIQFRGNYGTTQEQFISITYVNGYPNTTMSASVGASVTSLPVADLTGFLPGMRFTIYDADKTEICTVASSFTTAQGAGNLTLASGLQYSHALGISVSDMPAGIKQAAIFVTSAILKARGNAALVMQSLTPNTIQTANPSAASDLEAAWDILKPFRRIR